MIFFSEIDAICAIVFRLIQLILPSSRINKKSDRNVENNAPKKRKFYSMNESREAFMQICATEIEYRQMYDSKVKDQSCVAPFISLIGSLEAPNYFMVDFENISYKLFSFARAVDVCFKAYFVFNIAFPEACNAIWDFINQQFYHLTDTGYKTKPTTNTT